MSDQEFCRHQKNCGGCPLVEVPYATQLEQKKSKLRQLWEEMGPPTPLGEVQTFSLGPGGLRDRADLTHHVQSYRRLGLYNRDRTEIVHIERCEQMSPELGSWHQEFQSYEIPIDLGSVRLRVGPSGLRGVWLDFSHANVKLLFDQQEALRELLKAGVVEIGQRRKVLYWDENRLRLGDPEPKPWFQTYIGADLRPVELSCSIADFTQPSMAANRTLVGLVMDIVRLAAPQRVGEFGSGIGNFSLPLAAAVQELRCYELDRSSVAHLKYNLNSAQLGDRAEVIQGDFQNIREERRPDFSDLDLVFVDPPRTGLKKFLDPLFEMGSKARPPHFVYVSCFAESFCQDALRLHQLGYEIKEISILDQFPQSQHFEMVAHFVQV